MMGGPFWMTETGDTQDILMYILGNSIVIGM